MDLELILPFDYVQYILKCSKPYLSSLSVFSSSVELFCPLCETFPLDKSGIAGIFRR